MADIAPVFSESSIISCQSLNKGSVVRGTLDLRTKKFAEIIIGVGRGGTTGLSNGVRVQVYRTFNNDGEIFPAPVADFTSQVAPAYLKQINNNPGPYATGTVTLAVDGAGQPAAGEYVFFWGVTAIPANNGTALNNGEFGRIANYNGTTQITLDTGCKIQKIDNEYWSNYADLWRVPVIGGSTYAVVIDYADDAAGETVAVVAKAVTWDKDTVA